MSTDKSELAELQAAVERGIAGVRDLEDMRKACEEMDAARQELQQRIGTVSVAVQLLREARDE